MSARWPVPAGAIVALFSSCAHPQAVESAPVDSSAALVVRRHPVDTDLHMTPTGPRVNLSKLVRAGASFVDEMADDSEKNSYIVHVDAVKKGLTWSWQTGPDDDPTSGTVKTDDASLKTGHTISFISQGTMMPEGKGVRATPPFLLSRSVAKTLRSGRVAKISVMDVADSPLRKDGTEVKGVLVDGKPRTVSTIRATDGQTTVWFANDPQWPVLLMVVFNGENYIELKEVNTRGKPIAQARPAVTESESALVPRTRHRSPVLEP